MDIISIVLSIVAILGAGLSYYFYIKSKILNAANDVINIAEDANAIKEEKMTIAINEIKRILPAGAKAIFTDAVIEAIIQHAFDGISTFAQKQTKK